MINVPDLFAKRFVSYETMLKLAKGHSLPTESIFVYQSGTLKLIPDIHLSKGAEYPTVALQFDDVAAMLPKQYDYHFNEMDMWVTVFIGDKLRDDTHDPRKLVASVAHNGCIAEAAAQLLLWVTSINE